MSEIQQRRVWHISKPDFNKARTLADSINLSPLCAHLLMNRGIETPEVAQKFIHPSLSQLPNPASLLDCERSAQRLLNAIANNEKIVIYGDYDVDGVTSSALLWHFCNLVFNVQPQVYIPQRLREGYGLNINAVEKLAEEGTQLLITVDNGSSAIEEVARAQTLGVDVIIIDHHQVSNPEPAAYAHMNPHRTHCPYPDKRLAAVGVAFMLLIQVRALLRTDPRFNEIPEFDLRRLIDIVALGTVADVATLRGVNRILVRAGVSQLRKAHRPGLNALMEVAKGSLINLKSSDFGFKIGPRLNAAGRLDDARYGFSLLTQENQMQLRSLAAKVELFNKERRELQKKIEQEAKHQANTVVEGMHSLVLASADWHHGVVGIVASRIVEKYHRPTFILGESDNGYLKGSGRSTPSIDIKSCLDQCAHLLEKYGGHPAAAGVTLKAENLDQFRTALDLAVKDIDSSTPAPQPLTVDAEVELHDLNQNFMNMLELLEPFGHGNPPPTFLLRNIKVRPTLLKGGHLKLFFDLSGHQSVQGPSQAIGWNLGHRAELCSGPIDFVCTPAWDYYGGSQKIVLTIQDLYCSPNSPLSTDTNIAFIQEDVLRFNEAPIAPKRSSVGER